METMSTQLERLRSAYPWPAIPPAVAPDFGPVWYSDDERSGHARLFTMLVPSSARVIVELGSYLGRSAAGWLRLFPHAHVIAVDTWCGSPEHRADSQRQGHLPRLMETFQVNLWDERRRLTAIRASTLEGLKILHELGVSPDVIYVDADHATESVIADVSRSLDLFPDALVMGDDWSWPSVKAAVKAVASERALTIAACGPLWWFPARSGKGADAGLPLGRLDPSAEKVVTMTLFRRPRYARQVLEALARCEGIDAYLVLLHIESGYPEVLEVARRAKFARKILVENADVLGCSTNTRAAIHHGFQYADFVIYLDDDTVPAGDCLRFFEWARLTYRDDPTVFTVTPYAREAPSPDRYFEVIRSRWFTPWGWGTWRDRWEEISASWNHDPSVSWDVRVNAIRAGRFEVRPLLARIQNIGAEEGTHCPSPEFHRQFHFNEFGAWSVECARDGVFHQALRDGPT
jgi:predicted O-methyltransferase YrrM